MVSNRTKYWAGLAAAFLVMGAGGAQAQNAPAGVETTGYKPTLEDWIGVNAAVENYTLGLELKDRARFDSAFWPEATIIAEPEPGMRFTMPYRQAEESGPPRLPPGMKPPVGMMPPPPGMPPPGAPGGPPALNAAGTENPPWHLALNHHFEFQSPTKATHYGYFISVYPDLKTKRTVVGLPGHYEDLLEKRNGEWRILQRTTVIGVK